MKRLSIVIAWLLTLWLTLWAGWRICHSESDPWDEMYPFWGERPGERSYSVEHRYGNVTFPVHVVMGAKEWVSRQIEQGNCIQEPPMTLIFLWPGCILRKITRSGGVAGSLISQVRVIRR